MVSVFGVLLRSPFVDSVGRCGMEKLNLVPQFQSQEYWQPRQEPSSDVVGDQGDGAT